MQVTGDRLLQCTDLTTAAVSPDKKALFSSGDLKPAFAAKRPSAQLARYPTHIRPPCCNRYACGRISKRNSKPVCLDVGKQEIITLAVQVKTEHKF